MGHLLGTPGEGEGDGGEEGLGHEGDGHADGEDEAVLDGAADEQRDGEEEHAHGDGDRGDDAHDAAQPAGERRDRLGRRCRQPSDRGDPGAGSRRDDDAPGLTLDEERAGEDRLAVLDRRRHALAGEHRGVHEEPVACDQPSIGRHAVTALEEQHVVDHDLRGIDRLAAPVAADRHPGWHERAQPCRGPVRSGLLGEGEEGVDEDDRHDGDAELGEAGDDGEHGGDPEHEGEEVHQLTHETAHERTAATFREDVRSVAREPASGLVTAEP